MRVEVEMEEGKNRSSTSFEGDLCRERAAQFLRALQLSSAQKRRIRVEIDEGQNRTSMRFEGGLCRERAVQFMEALGVSSEPQPTKRSERSSSGLSSFQEPDEDLTLKERLKLFLKFDYSGRWFSSREAQRAYSATYGEEMGLSTVSTYLSRMYRDGFLERRGSRAEREYRVVEAPEGTGEVSGEVAGERTG
ncbi:MAG: hypothetical protein MAG715_00906 [Methanonatronarchaeales archaeon]|nr:hypothetical protein [Methanonatronarchaeales archaeon]